MQMDAHEETAKASGIQLYLTGIPWVRGWQR
jgi:hypothetical protein